MADRYLDWKAERIDSRIRVSGKVYVLRDDEPKLTFNGMSYTKGNVKKIANFDLEAKPLDVMTTHLYKDVFCDIEDPEASDSVAIYYEKHQSFNLNVS